jgi:hypothetical protein
MSKKKIILLVCAAAVLSIGSIAWFFISAWNDAAAGQREVFAAVSAADSDRMIAMFHPALRKEVDPPVLAAWFKTIKSKLGEFKDCRTTQFNTSASTDVGTRQESRATGEFERGSVESRLVFMGGKLTNFNFNLSVPTDNWLKTSLDTKFYRDRGQQFVEHLVKDEPQQAFNMMSEPLQDNFPLKKLKDLCTQIASEGHKNVSVVYQSESWDAAGTTLEIDYLIQSNNQPLYTAKVKFRFTGLKASLDYFLFEPFKKNAEASESK